MERKRLILSWIYLCLCSFFTCDGSYCSDSNPKCLWDLCGLCENASPYSLDPPQDGDALIYNNQSQCYGPSPLPIVPSCLTLACESEEIGDSLTYNGSFFVPTNASVQRTLLQIFTFDNQHPQGVVIRPINATGGSLPVFRQLTYSGTFLGSYVIWQTQFLVKQADNYNSTLILIQLSSNIFPNPLYRNKIICEGSVVADELGDPGFLEAQLNNVIAISSKPSSLSLSFLGLNPSPTGFLTIHLVCSYSLWCLLKE